MTRPRPACGTLARNGARRPSGAAPSIARSAKEAQLDRSATRTKVAVLGGGMAALAAAWELAKTERYEITVYTRGWRIGGKGASGRNMDEHERSEEHGLHVWFGCYDTAFRILRECYEAVDWPPGAQFQRVEDA